MSAGRVFWLTGLPGAGKSTIAQALKQQLGREGIAAVSLDGDELRALLAEKGDGYSREERLDLAMFYARLCRMLSGQGFTVICATVSLFHAVQDWNRKHISGYLEIFVDSSRATLLARNQKNLYAGAGAGTETHVVGIHITPEFPKTPDLTVRGDGTDTPESIAAHICEFVKGG